MILDAHAIEKLVNDMEKEVYAIKKNLIKSVWFMRGGLSLSEALLTSFKERELINEVINDNLETAKRTGQPFF